MKNLKILNLEDNAIKSSKIARVAKSICPAKIDWVRNLEDGLELIDQAGEDGNYDVIISDMRYPLYAGGDDYDSGDELVKELEKRNSTIPVVICSTIKYDYSGTDNVIGAVQYQENGDWDIELETILITILPNIKA